MNKPILIAFGTRPEEIKISPLLNHGLSIKLLFTGQHEHLLQSKKFDYRIEPSNGANRLDQIIADCLTQFPNEEFSAVLVQGDTASAFGCALAAFNRKIPVIHLEAGLRSFDLNHPYPEEGYRLMISRLAALNLCPTENAKQNLIDEKVPGFIEVTGNTVLDHLHEFKKDALYGNHVLITMHRRENHEIMGDWFLEINEIARDHSHLRFILPLHPNPAVQKHRDKLSHVEVIEPLGHRDFLALLSQSKFLITDSGGLQEEGSFFNKRVIVCRETTERPEALKSGHSILCHFPKDLKKLVLQVINNPQINVDCPFGDGKSGKRIAQILMSKNLSH